VANGWYFRDLSEVLLWRQSNRLVQGEKLWETAKRRDPAFTCAKLFWWYNMYSTADIAVTPRPMYPADGRKLPDLYTAPAGLRDELQQRLGQFPLFRFWGPAADIVSSRWIGRCALDVFERQRPTLTLVYLPHLDYNLQRLGPDHPRIAQDVAEVDQVCAELIEAAQRAGARVIALSEYGITAVSKPVHINRALRQAGHIQIREELGRELLDTGASRAFPGGSQIAHLCVRARVPRSSADQACPAWKRCWTKRASGRRDWTIRDRANWSPSPRPTAGSPTTISWTTPARRTSRAPSTSTASPATTRSSCSWTRRCRRRR
jgi:predicted AlkP superfamily pyrophosphatase or phosphodiesterase